MPTIDAASGNVLAIIDGTVGGASIPTAGDVAAGIADSGNPVKVGGKYNTVLPTLADGQRGDLQLSAKSIPLVALMSATGLAISAVPSVDGIIGSNIIALPAESFSLLYNGTTWDRARTPTVFKSFSALAIANETTVWTPAAGKKFRLMGFVVTQGVATGDIVVRDNTAGTAILTIPATPIGQPLSFSMGNGILSAAANNVLTFDGGVGETVSGFVYGTEE